MTTADSTTERGRQGSLARADVTFSWSLASSLLTFSHVPLLEWRATSFLGEETLRRVCSVHSGLPLAPISRFNMLTSEELATLSKGHRTPVLNFSEWAEWRSKAHPEEPVPSDVLCCTDAAVLNKWLSLYVIETRRKDGQHIWLGTGTLPLQTLTFQSYACATPPHKHNKKH